MKKLFGFFVFVSFLFVGCAGSGSKPAAAAEEETTVEVTVENLGEAVEVAADSVEVVADEVSDEVEEVIE